MEQWQPYCTRLIFLRHMEELSSRSHAALTGTGNHGYQRHSNMTPSHSTRFGAAVASARTFLFIICQQPTE